MKQNRTNRTTKHPRFHLSGRSVAFKVVSGVAGMAMVGGAAYGVTSWVVGLNAGSAAEAQSATVSNLTITAVAAPSATNQLYPGSTGDVVATITNPNPFPVTVTGVTLPANTVYANGYTTSALATTQTGCISTTPSGVTWNFATATSGTAHTLATALTVAGSGTLTVTFTNDATMTSAAPAACEGTFFSLPSLTGVVASAGTATATTSPTTDSWTS
ncbi:MAG TPA: hypothetical protein VGG17_02020 [Acidimicrobiales bacterium]